MQKIKITTKFAVNVLLGAFILTLLLPQLFCINIYCMEKDSDKIVEKNLDKQGFPVISENLAIFQADKESAMLDSEIGIQQKSLPNAENKSKKPTIKRKPDNETLKKSKNQKKRKKTEDLQSNLKLFCTLNENAKTLKKNEIIQEDLEFQVFDDNKKPIEPEIPQKDLKGKTLSTQKLFDPDFKLLSNNFSH